MDVALASCRVLPEPDPDAAPLAAALRDAGLSARVLAWDDPAADWSRARMTVLRSTWNYPLDGDGFVAWAERTARLSDLWNPLEVVRWNVHKSYLLDLERRGVPVTPTALLRVGSSDALASVLDAHGWDDVVIKPAVSAASYRTMRAGRGSLAAGEAHLRSLLVDRDVLVQPYLGSVDDHGERAVVWIDGEVTHAVRKTPRFAGEDESVSSALPVAPAEADLARRAVAAVPWPLLYARVDMAPGPDGRPVIMELELLEPSLFFAQCPGALARFVEGIRRRLDRVP